MIEDITSSFGAPAYIVDSEGLATLNLQHAVVAEMGEPKPSYKRSLVDYPSTEEYFLVAPIGWVTSKDSAFKDLFNTTLRGFGVAGRFPNWNTARIVTGGHTTENMCVLCPNITERELGLCSPARACLGKLAPIFVCPSFGAEPLPLPVSPIQFDGPRIPSNVEELAAAVSIKDGLLWFCAISSNREGKSRLYSVMHLKKKSGGVRVVYAPASTLKHVQRRLLKLLVNSVAGSVPGHVGAYVKNRGLTHTSSQHVGARVMIKADLVDFFHSTRGTWVKDALKSRGYNEDVADIVTSVCTVFMPVGTGEAAQSWRRVPQGTPTAGLLCNLVAEDRLDRLIMAAMPSGWVYTRYADDLTLTKSSNALPGEVGEVLEMLRSSVRQSGYRINKKKTRVLYADTDSLRVLGHSVSTHVNMPKSTYRLFRARVHRAVTGEPVDSSTVTALVHELTYWRSICPEKATQLLSKLQGVLSNVQHPT